MVYDQNVCLFWQTTTKGKMNMNWTMYSKKERDLDNVYGSKLYEINDLIWHDHYNYGLIIEKDFEQIVIAFDLGIIHFRINDIQVGVIEQATDNFFKDEPIVMFDAKKTRVHSKDEFIKYMKEHKQRQFKHGYIKK